MRDDYYKWVIPNHEDTKISRGLRYAAAEMEAKKSYVEQDIIIRLVNEFLSSMDMEIVQNPKIDCTDQQKFKKQLKSATINLDDERDIVWMKFTTDNYLGVVGTGDDINFDPSNTSGKIITHLQKEWDEGFVLVFPLIKSPRSPDILNRHLMESGIGNYLISKNVPILDFYSHNI